MKVSSFKLKIVIAPFIVGISSVMSYTMVKASYIVYKPTTHTENQLYASARVSGNTADGTWTTISDSWSNNIQVNYWTGVNAIPGTPVYKYGLLNTSRTKTTNYTYKGY